MSSSELSLTASPPGDEPPGDEPPGDEPPDEDPDPPTGDKILILIAGQSNAAGSGALPSRFHSEPGARGAQQTGAREPG